MDSHWENGLCHFTAPLEGTLHRFTFRRSVTTYLEDDRGPVLTGSKLHLRSSRDNLLCSREGRNTGVCCSCLACLSRTHSIGRTASWLRMTPVDMEQLITMDFGLR